MYPLARQLLFRLDAEQAHKLSLKAIEAAYRSGLNPLLAVRPAPLKTRAFGVEFANPVGCAAGLDKNGEHIDALMALGFRLRRDRNHHAATAGRQSQAADVPDS